MSDDQWVQIELPSTADVTERIQLNLKDITQTHSVKKGDELVEVIVFFERKNITLRAQAAKSFVEKWEAYKGAEITIRDTENIPSAIIGAGNINLSSLKQGPVA